MENKYIGKWVVVDGIDRVGKSTLINGLLLEMNSAGIKTIKMQFPNREGAIGRMLDRYLKGQIKLVKEASVLAFLADMAQEINKIMIYIRKGYNVICDRYTLSTFAYGMAQGGLTSEWLRQATTLLPEPDLTLVLLGDPRELQIRHGYGNEITEKIELQEKVRDNMRSELSQMRMNYAILDVEVSHTREEIRNWALGKIKDINGM